MTNIPNEVRERVRQRAGERCEYCLSQQEYVMGQLQVDHIQPVVKGGVDSEDNLCLACELCNQYKWTQIIANNYVSVETSVIPGFSKLFCTTKEHRVAAHLE